MDVAQVDVGRGKPARRVVVDPAGHRNVGGAEGRGAQTRRCAVGNQRHADRAVELSRRSLDPGTQTDGDVAAGLADQAAEGPCGAGRSAVAQARVEHVAVGGRRRILDRHVAQTESTAHVDVAQVNVGRGKPARRVVVDAAGHRNVGGAQARDAQTARAGTVGAQPQGHRAALGSGRVGRESSHRDGAAAGSPGKQAHRAAARGTVTAAHRGIKSLGVAARFGRVAHRNALAGEGRPDVRVAQAHVRIHSGRRVVVDAAGHRNVGGAQARDAQTARAGTVGAQPQGHRAALGSGRVGRESSHRDGAAAGSPGKQAHRAAARGTVTAAHRGIKSLGVAARFGRVAHRNALAGEGRPDVRVAQDHVRVHSGRRVVVDPADHRNVGRPERRCPKSGHCSCGGKRHSHRAADRTGIGVGAATQADGDVAAGLTRQAAESPCGAGRTTVAQARVEHVAVGQRCRIPDRHVAAPKALSHVDVPKVDVGRGHRGRRVVVDPARHGNRVGGQDAVGESGFPGKCL